VRTADPFVYTADPFVYTDGPFVYTADPLVYTNDPLVYTADSFVYTNGPFVPSGGRRQLCRRAFPVPYGCQYIIPPRSPMATNLLPPQATARMAPVPALEPNTLE